MRKFIIAIVILALVWAVPGARTHLVASAHPALERLGPSAEFVIRPARREAAKKQMNAILRVAASDINEGLEVPTDGRFQEWMRQRMPELGAGDPWGNPYWMTRAAAAMTVGSSGPDGRRGTEDDLTQTASF
jgi:hypothetical protein